MLHINQNSLNKIAYFLTFIIITSFTYFYFVNKNPKAVNQEFGDPLIHIPNNLPIKDEGTVILNSKLGGSEVFTPSEMKSYISKESLAELYSTYKKYFIDNNYKITKDINNTDLKFIEVLDKGSAVDKIMFSASVHSISGENLVSITWSKEADNNDKK